jgi:hypothetical protein
MSGHQDSDAMARYETSILVEQVVNNDALRSTIDSAEEIIKH